MQKTKRTTTRAIPKHLWDFAVNRISGHLAISRLLAKAHNQDTVDTLLVSAYTQGMEDALYATERREGTYEEER